MITQQNQQNLNRIAAMNPQDRNAVQQRRFNVLQQRGGVVQPQMQPPQMQPMPMRPMPMSGGLSQGQMNSNYGAMQQGRDAMPLPQMQPMGNQGIAGGRYPFEQAPMGGQQVNSYPDASRMQSFQRQQAMPAGQRGFFGLGQAAMGGMRKY